MRPVPGAGTGLSPLDDELGCCRGALTPLVAGEPGAAGELDAVRARGRELGWLDAGRAGERVGGRAADRSGRGGVRGRADGRGRAAGAAADARAGRAGRAAAQCRWGDDLAGRPAVGGGQDAGARARHPGGGRDGRGRGPLVLLAAGRAHRVPRLALVETHRRGVGTAPGWSWRSWMGPTGSSGSSTSIGPTPIRVLDFPHAVEYLTRASHEAFGAGTAATSEWLADPGPRPQARRPRPGAGRAAGPAARRAARHGPRLSGARLAQLQYPTFRAAGYPIGSGIVESANKVVVQDRLKGSGMHWAPAHVDPMLALRTIVCADRWDEAWPQISARLRADHGGRRI